MFILKDLFDNPIALEKDYNKLIIYKIPSLELFDRNSNLV